jgi:hypothetical protein
MAQVTPAVNKQPNKRQRDFIHNLVYLDMKVSDAFRQAGFSSWHAAESAKKCLARPYINRYYLAQMEQRAKEIQEERRVVTATIPINQQIQAEKLEKLRLKCDNEKDYVTALGCIREEDKVFGLVRDTPAPDGKEAEIDAAIREQASKLSAADFLALPPAKTD